MVGISFASRLVKPLLEGTFTRRLCSSQHRTAAWPGCLWQTATKAATTHPWLNATPRGSPKNALLTLLKARTCLESCGASGLFAAWSKLDPSRAMQGEVTGPRQQRGKPLGLGFKLLLGGGHVSALGLRSGHSTRSPSPPCKRAGAIAQKSKTGAGVESMPQPLPLALALGRPRRREMGVSIKPMSPS